MPQRPEFINQAQVTAFQPPRISSGDAQTYDTFEALFSSLAKYGHDLMDKDAVKLADEEAARVFSETGVFEPVDKRGLFWEQYNKTGLAAHGAALETQINTSMEAIAMKHTRDAAGYKEATDKFKEEILKVASAPLRNAVENLVVKQQGSYINAIEKDTIAFHRKQNLADLEKAGRDTKRAGEAAARHGRVDDVLAARERYVNLQDFALGTGLDPAQRDKNIEAFDLALNKEVIMGGFDRAMRQSDRSAVAYIESFRASTDTGLSPEEQLEVTKSMLAELGRDQSLETTVINHENTLRTERWRIGESQLAFDMLTNQLGPDDVITALAHDRVSPEFARKIEQRAIEGPPFSDPIQLYQYMLDPTAFEVVDIAFDNTVNADDRLKVLTKRQEVLDDQEGWRNSQNGIEGVRRIDNEFGFKGGQNAAFADPARVRRAGRVLTEYYERVESLPPEQRESKAVEIADQLIGSEKTVDKQKQLDAVNKRIEKNPYKTVEELDADENLETVFGSKKAEYNIQKQRLERLLRQRNQLLEDLK